MQAKLPRSYSVVAHHEGLSFLRPGFKSRYEHFHSIIHGRKEYVRYDAGTSSESKNVVVIR